MFFFSLNVVRVRPFEWPYVFLDAFQRCSLFITCFPCRVRLSLVFSTVGVRFQLHFYRVRFASTYSTRSTVSVCTYRLSAYMRVSSLLLPCPFVSGYSDALPSLYRLCVLWSYSSSADFDAVWKIPSRSVSVCHIGGSHRLYYAVHLLLSTSVLSDTKWCRLSFSPVDRSALTHFGIPGKFLVSRLSCNNFKKSIFKKIKTIKKNCVQNTFLREFRFFFFLFRGTVFLIKREHSSHVVTVYTTSVDPPPV